ncbi:hypothetical protein [Hansschlegelia zhihuaiae]|uniref:Uncharacterized protein n=1 Tax=Hansschlegelia zhihuaiae TaxID=405005 RepID=A0A4Q0MI76_9HYPH|nr:hypothetical protein [Hansschlegelia zhihuaiae]RXF73260.1 hypothetical protein EK403_10490 [Hansschlegelia zhihuaiae]
MDPPMETPTAVEDGRSALARIGTVAALAILLGVGVQALVLAAKILAGGEPSLAGVLADAAAGVAWATVVCAGAAIGVSISRAPAIAAGLIAALFAPLAVAAAKAANQVMTAAIGVVGKPAAASLVAISAVKAVEYGLLGFLLASLARRGAETAGPYLGAGAAVGLVFGAGVLALKSGAGAAAAELAATAINEIVFPIGCAAVVYAGAVASRAMR